MILMGLVDFCCLAANEAEGLLAAGIIGAERCLEGRLDEAGEMLDVEADRKGDQKEVKIERVAELLEIVDTLSMLSLGDDEECWLSGLFP